MSKQEHSADNEKTGEKTKSFAKRLKENLVGLKDKVLDAIFPQDITCDICGEELVAQTRYRICAQCMEGLTFIEGKRCAVCGVPMKDEAEYCLRCQHAPDSFLKNRSPLVYEGKAKQLIYQMKFANKSYIAKTLGALMADEYLNADMGCEIITFVPMSESEKKKRGFNQSELIAYEVGRRLNMPVLPALEKIKDTPSQKEITGAQRAQNLKGAFVCVYDVVKDRQMLLIDDVFTTGATANECSNVLLKAKARSVCVLTAAITPRKIDGERADEKSVRSE